MATRLLGTNANNTLTAIPWPNLATSLTNQSQEFAAICALIKDDAPLLWPVGNAGTAQGQNATQQSAAHNLIPTALNQGQLYIPNRGYLKLFPGDWIAVDASGWPILVSGMAIQNNNPGTSWTHTGNPT